MPTTSSPNDLSLVRAIVAAAKQAGANAQLMVATAMRESNLTWRPKPGDNGTSFGPFQHHENGALGDHPAAWASTVAAVQERATAFARAGASTGAGAAAVQRPADQASYAAAVDANMKRAAELIRQAGAGGTVASSSRVPTGTAVATSVESQLGVPYKWGGSTPATGFDCSGLVRWVLAKFNVDLPHNAAAQFAAGTAVGGANAAAAVKSLKPGDVVFFEGTDGPGITHNGIYVGNGQFVAAPHTGANVRTSSLTDPYYAAHYAGARRYVSGTAVTAGGTATAGTAGGGATIPGLPVDIPTPADVAGGAADVATAIPDGIAGAISGVGQSIAGVPSALEGAAEDVGAWGLTNVALPALFVLGGLALALYGLSHAFGGGGGGGKGGSIVPLLQGGGGGAGAGAGAGGALAEGAVIAA